MKTVNSANQDCSKQKFAQPSIGNTISTIGKYIPLKSEKITAIIIIIVLICVISFICVVSVNSIFEKAQESVSQEFQSAKKDAYNNAFGIAYNSSFEYAEHTHHVSNHITISLGDIQEIQNLEVLKVSEVDYQAPPQDDPDIWDRIVDFFNKDATSWLEIPGTGVFTVNLKASEFIVDSVHNHIIVRVPKPKLTNFTIDYENIVILNFDKGGIFKDSAKVGVDTAIKQLQNAELSIMRKVENNQEFYNTAKQSARFILENIIRQINSGIKNLTVDVEFLD